MIYNVAAFWDGKLEVHVPELSESSKHQMIKFISPVRVSISSHGECITSLHLSFATWEIVLSGYPSNCATLIFHSLGGRVNKKEFENLLNYCKKALNYSCIQYVSAEYQESVENVLEANGFKVNEEFENVRTDRINRLWLLINN